MGSPPGSRGERASPRVLVVHQFMSPGSPQDQQRGEIYSGHFASAGFRVTFMGRQPLPGLLLSRLPPGPSRAIRTSLGYRAASRAIAATAMSANDLRIVREARRSDVVLFIKTDSPSLVRRIRATSAARLVYDVADIRTRHTPELTRRVEEILPIVDAVTCDNGVVMDWARAFNGRVHPWPPVSYIEAFEARRDRSRRGTGGHLRLGWVGTPSTASNLYLILESLEDLFRSRNGLELRLVGIPADHDLLSRFEHVEATVRSTYTNAEMIDEVLQMDIGLFPQYDLLDAARKGVTKALIYMAGGALTVCSPVGELRDLVRDRETGLIAAGRQGWTAQLELAASDPGLRARVTDAARAVAAAYSLDRCFADLRAAMQL